MKNKLRLIRLFLSLAWRDWETGSVWPSKKPGHYRMTIGDAWKISYNIWGQP